jgi:hypothetical protein
MSTVSKISASQPTQLGSGEVPVQELFDKQRAYFATDATKTYEWRIDQLDRLIRMLKENYKKFSDASWPAFGTCWMTRKPGSARLIAADHPRFLAEFEIAILTTMRKGEQFACQ